MKSTLFFIFSSLIFVLVGWFANVAWNLPKEESPIISQIKPRPLEKYEIENLAQKYQQVAPSKIEVGDLISDEAKYTSHEFSYTFDPTFSNGQHKRVTGLINIPKGKGPFPTVIMFRGYVDQSLYTPGMGTKRVGEFFAQNGYITIAPDFLGYGGSDKESSDIFESRFQTYTTATSLIRTIGTLKERPLKVKGSQIDIDAKNIFIWAHSNGGQIALTALEITGVDYPTVLWAPNSAKFPYSILYYLDEAPDNGKLIITELAQFMADYDVSRYAFTNYLNKIKASIQVQQGTNDDAIPVLWSENLVKNLEINKIDALIIKLSGSDHNMNPNWQQAVINTLAFFNQNLAVK